MGDGERCICCGLDPKFCKKPSDNVAYVYTRKPKKGELVKKTVYYRDGIYIDKDKDGGIPGVEFLKVYEIWVDGKRIWRRK